MPKLTRNDTIRNNDTRGKTYSFNSRRIKEYRLNWLRHVSKSYEWACVRQVKVLISPRKKGESNKDL